MTETKNTMNSFFLQQKNAHVADKFNFIEKIKIMDLQTKIYIIKKDK